MADLEGGRAKLLTSGWVEDATLRRVVPSTIEVVVDEREPVGLGRFGTRLYLVDAIGHVIDEFGPRFSEFNLPIIDGLTATDGGRQVSVEAGRADLAARLIEDVASRAQLAARISQVDVGDPHDVVVLLSGDPALIHLGRGALSRASRNLSRAGARDSCPRAGYRLRRPQIRPAGVRPSCRSGGVRGIEDGRVQPAWGRRQGDHSDAGSQSTTQGRLGGRSAHGVATAVNGGSVARKEQYLVGLDVGTSKIAAIVGEAMEDGSLDIIGIGVAEAKGIRRGVVVNLEAAVESIKKAIEEAELTAGVEIDSVHLGLSGGHAKAFNSRGVVAVAGKNREITREDVRRAIDAAKAVSLPSGREILHVLPQDFVVDEQDGIGAPIGMTGARLEVNVHIVTGSSSSTQNIVACVNRAGVAVVDTVLEQLAAAESVLTSDEKELGVALVDIGGGTADFAVFERGSLWHTGALALGGDHFTNDIAVGLRTPIPEAEKTKRRSGCALAALVDEEQTIEVASVGGRQPRIMSRRILADVLQPRAEEIFHQLWDEVRRAGYERLLHSGIVLTGGGSILDGMPEIADQIFDLPIRRGCPIGVGGLTDHVNTPAFATAVGVVMYAHRNQAMEQERAVGGALSRVAGRLRGLFKEFL